MLDNIRFNGTGNLIEISTRYMRITAFFINFRFARLDEKVHICHIYINKCPTLRFYLVRPQGALFLKLCAREFLHAPLIYVAIINGSKNVHTPGAPLILDTVNIIMRFRSPCLFRVDVKIPSL